MTASLLADLARVMPVRRVSDWDPPYQVHLGFRRGDEFIDAVPSASMVSSWFDVLYVFFRKDGTLTLKWKIYAPYDPEIGWTWEHPATITGIRKCAELVDAARSFGPDFDLSRLWKLLEYRRPLLLREVWQFLAGGSS